jgi:hypothetical protein
MFEVNFFSPSSVLPYTTEYPDRLYMIVSHYAIAIEILRAAVCECSDRMQFSISSSLLMCLLRFILS